MPAISVSTDAQGRFTQSTTYNPPGWLDIRVQLQAVLQTSIPGNVTLDLCVQAANGSIAEQRKSVTLTSNEPVDLGVWQLDGGDNIVTVNGQTSAAIANKELTFQLNASLAKH